MILILGAPRTGSTLLYQIIVNHFVVWYPANDGTFHLADKPVSYQSHKGKTKEPYEPSEASELMERWFMQDRTARPDRETELTTVLDYHKPWVIKNIWNVWRVDEWVRLFPVQFIWIRRNELDAAISDARTATGYNHAYRTFTGQKQEKWYGIEQAVHQQKEINKIIAGSLLGKDFMTVYYNDLCERTAWTLLSLRKFLKAEYRDRPVEKLVAHVY